MSYLYPKKRGLPIHQILLVLALGLGLGLAAAYFFFSPRVLSIAPPSDARSGSYAAVEIRFSVPMGADCTADRFSVDPPVEGELVVQGAVLRFTPKDPWPEGGPVRASIAAGACSGRGLPLLSGRSWSFTPSLVRVAYVPVGDAGGRLMGVAVDGGDPAVLALLPDPVQDFNISRRGDFAVLATGSSAGPGKLWFSKLDGAPAELLLDCGEDSCRDPAISPDGSLVAFVRDRPGSGPGDADLSLEPFVQLLPVAGGAPRAVSPGGDAAEHPAWSPQGWLSYYDGTRQAIVVDDLAGGQTSVPDTTGAAWSWFPDGSALVFPEIEIAEGDESEETAPRLLSFLFQVYVSSNRRVNLSGADLLEDTSPAVSPDGTRLAFARNFFDARWTPGRQLWILDLRDSSLTQLTRSPDYSHTSIHWSPDGSRLTFMLFHETVPADPPEIWSIGADGSDPRRLIVGGFLPQWLP
jgi:dipeptidyl aminopeptidase/acylaminoacyl peptidase